MASETTPKVGISQFVKFGLSESHYSLLNRVTTPPHERADMRHIGMIMSLSISDFQEARDRKSAELEAQILDYYLYLPSKLTPRAMLPGKSDAWLVRRGIGIQIRSIGEGYPRI